MTFEAEGEIRIVNSGVDSRPWLVIACDPSIGEYYRAVVKWLSGERLSPPLYGYHITVLAGKHVSPATVLRYSDLVGKKVQYNYTGKIYTNDRHCWINVDCPAAREIMEREGVTRNLHMSVGCHSDRPKRKPLTKPAS
jgi:hypothetical protein